MATLVRIAARGPSEAAVRTAVRAAFAEIRRLEDIVSTFDPASDASRLNRSAGAEPISVAPELAELLTRSQALSRQTDGAFSVLVGPLLEAWRNAETEGSFPDPAQIDRALGLGRPGLVAIAGRRVGLRRSGMRIDLGGVAKGFAADRALGVLRARGVAAAIVDLGGSSIAAFGDAGDGAAGWPVALPVDDDDGSPWTDPVLRLREGSLSTSVSKGRPLAPGGRPGHIVDPRDGRLLDLDAVAIVRHASATEAEALSKALLVLAADAAPIFGAAAADGVLLVRSPAQILCTPGFRTFAESCTVLDPRRRGAVRAPF
jgi:thiamine biosynthesis lipoprotein